MTDRNNLPDNRSSTLPERSRLTWSEKLKPASVTEAVALLSSCLALVKPVGMSGDDAQVWLRVAAGELAHLPSLLIAQGCAHARRTCTHHGQIVPAIIANAEPDLRAWSRYAADEREKAKALPAPDRWIPKPGELEAIKAEVAAKFPSNRD